MPYIGACFRFYTQIRVEKKNKAFAYRVPIADYNYLQCIVGFSLPIDINSVSFMEIYIKGQNFCHAVICWGTGMGTADYNTAVTVCLSNGKWCNLPYRIFRKYDAQYPPLICL